MRRMLRRLQYLQTKNPDHKSKNGSTNGSNTDDAVQKSSELFFVLFGVWLTID